MTDQFKATVQVIKVKNGTPTVIRIDGQDYVLRHKDQFKGGSQNGKDK